MTRRRRNPKDFFQIDGILPIDKPEGLTSHDVVHKVRRHFDIRKVGHGGTLDPAATGLLILLLGKGTKASDQIMTGDKGYSGTFTFGISTDSYDREGEILQTKDCSHLTKEQVQEQFELWTGDVEQIPPMVSAIKKDGTPLYKLARKGQEIEREARALTVHQFTIERFELPEVDFDLLSTKGTYVRSLAHDIGTTLGCGAHLSALRRTVSGDYTLDQAYPLDAVLAMESEALREIVLPVPAIQK